MLGPRELGYPKTFSTKMRALKSISENSTSSLFFCSYLLHCQHCCRHLRTSRFCVKLLDLFSLSYLLEGTTVTMTQGNLVFRFELGEHFMVGAGNRECRCTRKCARVHACVCLSVGGLLAYQNGDVTFLEGRGLAFHQCRVHKVPLGSDAGKAIWISVP